MILNSRRIFSSMFFLTLLTGVGQPAISRGERGALSSNLLL
jgi:hypothetical protein